MNENDYSKDNPWLLPEGVDELLPPRAMRVEQQRRELLDLFSAWGYELIMPPFIEFLDSLLTGSGHDLDLETFKLTDQLSGRLMGVRADMTPQAARIDAHQLLREGPVRLCYIGTVLKTRPDAMGGSRDPLQLGAELFGHAGIESDVEVISLMLEVLRTTGVHDLYLDLGHVGIYRGLTHQAGLGDEIEARFFDALQRKAAIEIEELLGAADIDSTHRAMLAALPDLNGGTEVLQRAVEELRHADKSVREARDELAASATSLQQREPSLPLYFDLAELHGYQYKTGAVFAAFTPGYGQELARGGRYDNIGRIFGRARPATGFSADLKALAALTAEPVQTAAAGVLADWTNDAAALAEVRRLREQGERVVWSLPGQQGNGGCDRRLVQRKDGSWAVEPL